ncbi:coagulation factor XIII B chain-like isoform X3 [Clavelina lepadiformis]|uniref:coagulation factor XIII B chain-like isoform X3 n=1 Tax=Clavelina lepadiformis TaxID=159417 RepID=UPI004040EA99
MKSKIFLLFFICSSLTPRASSQGTCGRPLVDEAVYRPFQNEFAVGESVTYSCRTGHQLQSGYTSLSRTCQADLTWSSVEFVCERQSCGFPDTPSNGHIVGDTYTFGNTIEYFCNTGFELSTGASSVRSNCVPVVGSDPPTVEWSVATAPTCSRVPCPNPPNIANGRFEDSGVAYEYGARIEYFCDNGFKSNEASPIHRTCDENGTWGDPPQCLVDYDCDFENFHQPTCGYSNTRWSREFRRDGLSGRSYVLHRSSDDATLTSAALTIEPPGACLSFYYRGTLGGTRLEVSQTTPGTSDTSLSGGISESDWQEAKIDLTPSNNVEFNVKVSGDPADVEIDDLTLNLSPCVPCPNPPNIANGRFEDSGVAYEYGARIEYFCDNGFKSNEASPIHRTCDENGTWGDPPQCLEPFPMTTAPPSVQTSTTRRMSTTTTMTTVQPTGAVPTTTAPPSVSTTFASIQLTVDGRRVVEPKVILPKSGNEASTEDTNTLAPPTGRPLSVPAIVGIAVGAVAVVLILSFIVYFCHAKKKGIPGVPMSL